jgi:F-type H+-transporting ATPase subunit a
MKMKLLKNKIVGKRIAWIISLLFLAGAAFAAETEEMHERENIDVQELVFGHINDDYSWHITTIGETHVSIPLLVIVRSSERGWFVFSSSRFHHGHDAYEGFEISQSKDYNGKIVEFVNGEEVRPLDISITKNVLSLFISCTLILIIFLSIARRYKRDPLKRPTGLQAILEPVILTLDEDVTKACIGKNYKKFSPYILTAFFFIFFNNLLGIVPIFPGGANLTGNIAITFVLAFLTFIITNIFGTKEYWKEVFWPEVPTWLKVPVPLMPLIEVIGIFTKPIALMIRLFANMLAGHVMVLVLIGLIFIFSVMSPYVGAGVSVLSVLLVVFMTFLELLVCFIQAYVFVTLSALFIGLAQVEPHHHHSK